MTTKSSTVFANEIRGFDGENPFSDSQSRNYSDQKVFCEFYPIGLFWTLFNDQHEVLLGTRGSGKTFLLKMMRYSMLKRIDDQRARNLVSEKKFIAMYVPLHLEFVLGFTNKDLSKKQMIDLFKIAFNCYLAKALLTELTSLVEEIEDEVIRFKTQIKLTHELEEAWFGEVTSICDFYELTNRIDKLYNGIDWEGASVAKIPSVFRNELCTPLVASQKIIAKILEFKEEPTWIICVDEAEFLNDDLQKCINSFFRSDSNRITLKVATLPYYHSTLETMIDGVSVAPKNDFNYTLVDLAWDSQDFIGLTNRLCSHRLKERFLKDKICDSVEDFVGRIGGEEYIDYYSNALGKKSAIPRARLQEDIIASLSEKRREKAKETKDLKKAFIDKFAPIFYVREMKKLDGMGNSKPGWYAGAKTIRRVSQGNPRLFIQVMSELFDEARRTTLSTKVQHVVIYNFASDLCESTMSLEKQGKRAHDNLDIIAKKLSDRIHLGDMVAGGNAFTIKTTKENFENEKEWIKVAVAYSRIIVDEKAIKNGFDEKTKLTVSNAYCIKYWIPMRTDEAISIALDDTENDYEVPANKSETYHQYTIFEDESNEN